VGYFGESSLSCFFLFGEMNRSKLIIIKSTIFCVYFNSIKKQSILSFREVNHSNDHSLSFSILNNSNSQNYTDENSTLKRSTIGRSDAKRLQRKIKKYQIGEAIDDVRLCIMCLRAIMNNQVVN